MAILSGIIYGVYEITQYAGNDALKAAQGKAIYEKDKRIDAEEDCNTKIQQFEIKLSDSNREFESFKTKIGKLSEKDTSLENLKKENYLLRNEIDSLKKKMANLKDLDMSITGLRSTVSYMNSTINHKGNRKIFKELMEKLQFKDISISSYCAFGIKEQIYFVAICPTNSNLIVTAAMSFDNNIEKRNALINTFGNQYKKYKSTIDTNPIYIYYPKESISNGSTNISAEKGISIFKSGLVSIGGIIFLEKEDVIFALINENIITCMMIPDKKHYFILVRGNDRKVVGEIRDDLAKYFKAKERDLHN